MQLPETKVLVREYKVWRQEKEYTAQFSYKTVNIFLWGL